MRPQMFHSTTPPQQAVHKTIMVVEDSRLLRNVYETILQDYVDEGFELSMSPNGKHALEVLVKLAGEGERPQAILLDLNMPIMGGIEFLRRLRANPLFANIPVVVLSTEPLKVVREALKAGANDYLRKPFNITELRPILEDLLS